MRILSVITLVFMLTACATIQQSTRLSTKLNAKEYNSIASNYMNRPTFTSVEKMSGGETVLTISMKSYRSTSNVLRFQKKYVPEYLSLIQKYMDWEQLAKSRGDAFTKEIGRASSWGNALSGTLKFTFHSGNSNAHFLAVSFCATGTCLDNEALYFDKFNAIELSTLLKKLESETLRQNNIENIYN